MSKPKIGIVVGSVREGRFAEKALDWFKPIADARSDLDFVVLDLLEFDLPLFNEAPPSSGKPVKNPNGKRWRQALAELDGFVFLTAEYNHGPTAALKNAIDWAWYEWNKKPVAFIGYGNTGAARAIEQLREIAVEVELVSVRKAIHVGGAEMMAIWSDGKSIGDFDHFKDEAATMLDSLCWWAETLKPAREEAKKNEAA